VPFSGELDLEEASSYKIKVNNKSRNEAAVKISGYKWSFDKNGIERREVAKELTIFPKQVLIQPNSSQHIRISLQEGIVPRIEKSYRIIVEELPVRRYNIKSNYKGASINVLTRYVTSFYIKPSDPISKVKVTESRVTKNGFLLGIKNIGNAHTHFIDPKLTITQKNESIMISNKQALSAFSKTNLLASNFRVYDWKFPEKEKKLFDLTKPFNVSLEWNCENCNNTTDSISFAVNSSSD